MNRSPTHRIAKLPPLGHADPPEPTYCQNGSRRCVYKSGVIFKIMRFFMSRDVRWRKFPYEQNKLFSYSVIGKIASRCATRHGATPNWAKIPASIRPPSSPVLHSSGPLQIRSVPWLPQTDSSPSAAPRLPRTIGCRRRTNRLVPSTLHGGGG